MNIKDVKIPSTPALLGLSFTLTLLIVLAWSGFYGYLISMYNIYAVLLLALITCTLTVAFLIESYLKNKRPDSFTKKVRIFALIICTAYAAQMIWLVFFLISFGRALNTLD